MRASSVAFAVLGLVSGVAALSASVDGCALPGFSLAVADAGSGPVDAGQDATMPPPTPGCMSAQYPDPPGGTDSPTSLGTLVFAMHSIDMGDGADTPGYDLDYQCTCFDDAGPTCVGESSQLSTYCDADGGIDSQAAKLFELVEVAVGEGNFGSDFFSAEASEGKWSLLISVSGYSGAPDDPVVQVALYPSPGLPAPPAWDGTDKWPVVSTSVGDGGVNDPVFKSTGAYVAGGVLVASMPITELTISGGSSTISVKLSSGVLTGNLVEKAGGWSLQNGVIAARWALSDVFKSLSSYRDNNGMPICTNSGFTYTTAKTVVCNDADILVDGTQPKSNPCDALSVGLGFEADPALFGKIADAGAVTDGCSPATDPANDSCP